jgi:rubredoxin
MNQLGVNPEKKLRKWVCTVCDLVYDEAFGLPEEGIQPGTLFEEIPDSWECPECGVTKDAFICQG